MKDLLIPRLLILLLEAFPATFRVPAQYGTIQEAIDAAWDGDTSYLSLKGSIPVPEIMDLRWDGAIEHLLIKLEGGLNDIGVLEPATIIDAPPQFVDPVPN